MKSVMLMKDGNSIPEPMAEALEQDEYALTVFMKMRPSCQRRYVEHIIEAKSETIMRMRVASAIIQIHKYGHRHEL